MNVADDESVAAAAKAFADWNFTLDILMNNAAILLKEDNSLLNDPSSIYSQTINTNCHGALRVTRAFLRFMKNQGRMINVSSGGGSMTDPVGGWSPAYCASKTLLNGLTRQLAYELEP